MKREFRVLSALADTAVPVPKPVALCTDPAVLDRPFYVMADVPGDVISTPEDGARLTSPQRARLAESVEEIAPATV